MTASEQKLNSSPDSYLSAQVDDCPRQDLRECARTALDESPIFRGRLALGAIQIEAVGDKLVLRGRLPSYYLKQHLQELTQQVAGVSEVENQVEVTIC